MNAKSRKKKLLSKTNFAQLRKKDDSKIDYREIPETDAKFWESAKLIMPDCYPSPWKIISE
jgi:hypothetical protein